jgi:hypothetical protein
LSDLHQSGGRSSCWRPAANARIGAALGGIGCLWQFPAGRAPVGAHMAHMWLCGSRPVFASLSLLEPIDAPGGEADTVQEHSQSGTRWWFRGDPNLQTLSMLSAANLPSGEGGGRSPRSGPPLAVGGPSSCRGNASSRQPPCRWLQGHPHHCPTRRKSQGRGKFPPLFFIAPCAGPGGDLDRNIVRKVH